MLNPYNIMILSIYESEKWSPLYTTCNITKLCGNVANNITYNTYIIKILCF